MRTNCDSLLGLVRSRVQSIKRKRIFKTIISFASASFSTSILLISFRTAKFVFAILSIVLTRTCIFVSSFVIIFSIPFTLFHPTRIF